MFQISRRSFAITAFSAFAVFSALPAAAQSQPYIGQIMCAAFNFEPQGWARLDGQLLPISQNTALFSLLGTQFGGNGQTTFALPDLRGRTIIHNGQGPGLSSRVIGEQAGTETTTLSTANLPAHDHSFAPLGSANDASSVSPAGKVAASKARTTLYTDANNVVPMAAGTTGSTGSSLPVNNMQPFLTINCFIALQGIYPPRN